MHTHSDVIFGGGGGGGYGQVADGGVGGSFLHVCYGQAPKSQRKAWRFCLKNKREFPKISPDMAQKRSKLDSSHHRVN